ncbi:hypothetical protein [Corynebacterium glucuronolyticum]|uniref:hypothetical protein n=1 Tax=Corynebacterium glucuronolyticum TaxID=39791 RepID=UPI00019C1EC3|nr:hypothetical protein [Corynebacterium glucuronolyticum]EEI27094.1 hypothetical protein HMPREF0294_1362 [Corynebacterium glucuronolyticum ATCC 51867]QRO82661.1 hypothetical protein I6J20_00195 [Corynebacterium glucuronolyticum]
MSLVTKERVTYSRFSPITALKVAWDRFACDLWCWSLPFLLYSGLSIVVGAKLQFGDRILLTTVVAVLMGLWHGIVADASTHVWRGEKNACFYFPCHWQPAAAGIILWTVSSLSSLFIPFAGLVLPFFFTIGVTAAAADRSLRSFVVEPLKMFRAVPVRTFFLILLASALAIIGVFALFIGSAITYPLAIMLLSAGFFMSRGEKDRDV